MLYLLLSLGCSVLLGFIFKLFMRYGVDTYQAIVFNYLTCFCCGWLHLGHFPIKAEHFGTPWMPYALVLGLIFISGFNTAALTVRHFGVTISQIMQKMSILLTVPFAVLVYGDSSGVGKILGFLLALASIVLVNWPDKKTKDTPSSEVGRPMHLLWIPLVTWLLSGILEVLFVRVQYEKLADTNDPTFIITIFTTAGVLGFLGALVGWFQQRLQFSWKHVLGGIVLGVPNYGSMLFMLWALNSGLEGSFVFPVTNVGIIVATTIGAVVLFHERLSRINWIGFALAVLAIVLISI
jgi:drug/metabolite transporter (DMT)-like permease